MSVSKIFFRSLRGTGSRTGARRGQCLQAERLESRGLLSGGLTPTSLGFGTEPFPLYGQGFLLSTYVRIASGTTPPTGTVTYTIDGVSQPPIEVGNVGMPVGISVLALMPPIAPGTHYYTASYSGDSNYAPSFASTQNTVEPLPTAVQLASRSSSSSRGQPVTFNVTVTAVIPKAQGILIPVPPFTGSVSFLDGATLLQRVPVDAAGNATLTTSALSLGSHQISVVYSGNTDLGSSTSNTVLETIDPPDKGPIITSVRRFGYHAQPTELVLTFNKVLAAGPAQDTANYSIVRLNRRGRPVGRSIAVATATSDATPHTVTLTASHRLNVHWTYRLTVSGSAPNGLTDGAGVLLAGSGEGHPGTDYTAIINRRSLAGPSVVKPSLVRRAAVDSHKSKIGRSW